jgi:hypothetical protein
MIFVLVGQTKLSLPSVTGHFNRVRERSSAP